MLRAIERKFVTCGDHCLEDMNKDYYNCSAVYCVPHMAHNHTHTHIWSAFTGPVLVFDIYGLFICFTVSLFLCFSWFFELGCQYLSNGLHWNTCLQNDLPVLCIEWDTHSYVTTQQSKCLYVTIGTPLVIHTLNTMTTVVKHLSLLLPIYTDQPSRAMCRLWTTALDTCCISILYIFSRL